jgi:Na+/H+ antiporter NhaD/arsenite permease-like protein
MQSGIPYSNFLFHLLPISLIGMLLIIVIVKQFFRKEFKLENHLVFQEEEFKYNFKSMKISVPIFAGIIILFFFSHTFNISIPLIALAGASLILIFGKIKPSKVIKEVDWVLLLFFAGLFIVVHGIEKVGVLDQFINNTPISNNLNGIVSLHFLSLVLSQIVSNVPYTILMLPILKSASSDLLWLSLASAATLAGNATIIGAVANLIVIEVAKKYNVKIGFWQFFRVGILITFITLIISIIILYLQLKWALL